MRHLCPCEGAPPKRSPTHYLWAVLIARIYEVFPLLWDDCDAQAYDGVHIEPDWDLAAQPAPGYEVDQRISARRTRRNAMGCAYGTFSW